MDINELSIMANRMADEYMQQTGCSKEERDKHYHALLEGMIAKNKATSIGDNMIEPPVKGNMICD